MSRFHSSVFSIILFLISSPASSWSPDAAHIAHPSTLSKDLSNVKRIWYAHRPDNPGELGNVWGIQSRDDMKRMHEGPLAPQQRAMDPDTDLELVHNVELGRAEEEEEEEKECEDYYYDGMTGGVYCWTI